MKKIAILQPNYLPWKGVFDMIYQVNQFVFLEDVQYTQHDWRNRNKIVTSDGVKWITVPVKNSDRFEQKIYEAHIDNRYNWRRKHKNAIAINYKKARYFEQYKYILDEIYDREWETISELNMYTTKMIAKVLGIGTSFISSLEIPTTGEKTDRLIEICKYLEADAYLSGPAAKSYIEDRKFIDNNIKLEYIEYNYPVYKQLYGEFEHGVTILDLIFNCGPESMKYIVNS
ncbi:MAG: WbqC family protein [Cellulosilyticum sp.]|nr:WbqC family protein [Cellulosilyticum sp.]